jgi:hypothetical protein
MHHIVARMFKHVVPGSLETIVLGRHDVQLWTVDAMTHVDFRRLVNSCGGLQVTSRIQEREERVDVY